MSNFTLLVRLHIQSYDDRMQLVKSLTNAGYAVKIEEVKDQLYASQYFVNVYQEKQT